MHWYFHWYFAAKFHETAQHGVYATFCQWNIANSYSTQEITKHTKFHSKISKIKKSNFTPRNDLKFAIMNVLSNFFKNPIIAGFTQRQWKALSYILLYILQYFQIMGTDDFFSVFLLHYPSHWLVIAFIYSISKEGCNIKIHPNFFFTNSCIIKYFKNVGWKFIYLYCIFHASLEVLICKKSTGILMRRTAESCG